MLLRSLCWLAVFLLTALLGAIMRDTVSPFDFGFEIKWQLEEDWEAGEEISDGEQPIE